MKRSILLILILLISVIASVADNYELLSPDGKIRVEVKAGEKLEYAVFYEDNELILPSEISMHTEKNGAFGINPKVKSEIRDAADLLLIPEVKQKSAEIVDKYNELTLTFKGNYTLVFRAYDEGVAYRWESNMRGEMIIVSEEANLSFSNNYTA